MSLFIASLNSGSNGNCYYVGNNDEAILVDAGISCKETEKRMARLGLRMDKLKAIFISHEHTDHIKGVCSLVKKYQIPVYITKSTLLNCPFTLENHLVRSFDDEAHISIGSLDITGFKKCHDAADPYSFIISCNAIKVGVFTDLGVCCPNLVKHFKQCHAAFLEANYDEEMLDNGGYPYHLKRRIKGGKGHLSNKEALELFIKHRPPYMTHLLLAHLSKNNNCPIVVSELFNKHASGVNIVVASRYEETGVYEVSNKRKVKAAPLKLQMSFQFA